MRLRALALALSCIVILTRSLGFAQEQERPAKIKAALVYYIAKFVQWPDKPNNTSQLNLCVYGTDLVSKQFHVIFGKKSVGNRPIVIKEISLIDSQTVVSHGCDLLYFSNPPENESEYEMLSKIESELKIITICPASKLRKETCVVQIFEQANKAKLAINRELVRKTKFSIGSELLDISVDPNTFQTDKTTN